MNSKINTTDFDERPFIAIWEVTQACDLACVHCRASAQPARDPMELSTDEGAHLIDQIAAMRVPVFVLTGGDSIKRPNLFELIAHARSVGVRVSLGSLRTDRRRTRVRRFRPYGYQGAAGHKTIIMSACYSHLSPEHRQSVVERIAGTGQTRTSTE